MNILYLLFSFTTGGTERLVADICNEMAQRNHNVHLYIVNDLYTQSMLDTLDPQVRVYLQKRPVGGGGKLQTLWGIAEYIRQNRIDVVHCNSLDAPELLLLKPLLCPKAKVLYTVHGMHQMQTKSPLKIRFRNLICHRIIAISDCVREDILAAGIHDRKVTTVPNAISLAKFSTPSQKRFDPAAPVIGNVARILPALKGQDVLIRAIGILKQEFPGITCLFAGAPAKHQEQELLSLKALTEQLGLQENIQFLGNVEDVPDFLSKIDVFALPSRSEGFGISLIEALAMGIPCVASALDGPAEVLRGGEYGTLFTPDDPQDLAQKLRLVLLDYAAQKAAAKTRIAYVQQNYAIQTMCDRLEKLMK